ncbi:MAG: septum formation inhibitor [Ruminococcus sp.]|nr:septum formation inhibitor [Ruminococcus sp.]
MAELHHAEDNLAVRLHYEENDKEDKRTAARDRKRKGIFRISPLELIAWVVLITVALALMGSYIFGRVEISRLYSERAQLESKLAVIENENISMESEIAAKMNVTKVEDYAKNNLGLQKLDKLQIQYIEVETPSVAEVKENDSEDIFVKIKHRLDVLKEYLGL